MVQCLLIDSVLVCYKAVAGDDRRIVITSVSLLEEDLDLDCRRSCLVDTIGEDSTCESTCEGILILVRTCHDSVEDLKSTYEGALSCSVGTDIAYHFSVMDRKAYVPQRVDHLIFPVKKRLAGLLKPRVPFGDPIRFAYMFHCNHACFLLAVIFSYLTKPVWFCWILPDKYRRFNIQLPGPWAEVDIILSYP